MTKQSTAGAALRAAFPKTLPILAGFLFLGFSYGIYMNVSGFSFLYPLFMSLLVFAGSVEFVAVSMLLGAFDPVQALLMTIMINARHLFYGISMLDKYRGLGKKKPYLIFGLCDETFSINYTAQIPKNVDKGWFFFFVTLLNHLYWVLGATLGGLFGSLVQFDTRGLEFAMPAMFLVIFLEQWLREDRHTGACVGFAACLPCLFFFGADRFLIPSMLAMLILLTALRRSFVKGRLVP